MTPFQLLVVIFLGSFLADLAAFFAINFAFHPSDSDDDA